jgi:hypothetical protein
MKAVKIASLDGEELDYVCVSIPDGEDLETYASQRFIEQEQGCAAGGEIVDFFIEDDKLVEYLQFATIDLIRIANGTVDFIA